MEAHCAELQAAREEMSPALSLVLHCVRLAEVGGYSSSETAVALAHELMLNASPNFAALMNALAAPSLNGREILELVQSVQPARNPEDLAFDLVQVAAAGRRFLDRAYSTADTDAVLLAIDLLGDLTVSGTLGESGVSGSHSTMVTRHRIRSILPVGFRLVLLGLTESGRLIRATFVNGELEELSAESDENFSPGALRKWADRYPYSYTRSNDPNVFWVTTERLRITISGTLPTIFVMDTRLQQFPVNLIRIGDDFAGRLFPACSSPSISWLSATREQRISDKAHRHAWIPTGTSETEDIALIWLAARIESCVYEFGFAVNHAMKLPEDYRNSEIVVVAAHGGLLPEGRIIHRISASDDFAIFPEALASACAGSAVVILFICSGGRLDSHPAGQTTIGLVKQLLDKRCRSIIASPWPLDVKVPPCWLAAFMDRWTTGDAIIDAVYHANTRVGALLGGDLVDCLAMNLFGDPFLTFSDVRK